MNPSLNDRKPAYQLGHPFKCVSCGGLLFVPVETYDRGLRLMLCSHNRCQFANAMVEVLESHLIQFPAASERLGSAPAQACDVTRRGDSSCRGVPRGPLGEVELHGPSDELSGGAQ
jgi:hypothetical protein